ncbi:MAG TPA: extracellular solute-binding protein [Candidatus Dormibacteraeota bacterium]
MRDSATDALFDPGPQGTGISRRSFLTTALVVGTAAASGGLLLPGCSSASPASQGGAGSLSKLQGILPSYVPVSYVKPDLPSVNGAPPGFLKYPANLVQTIKQPAGSGGSATAMTPAFWPIPPSPSAYYDAVNKRLGVDVQFQIVNGGDYGAKISALLAGKQLPDMTVIPTWNFPPRFSEAVAPLFADITDHVKGDNVKKYAYLANLPTASWQYCTFGGRIYGVPFPNGLFPLVPFYRKDIFDKLGATQPKNSDDFLKLGQQLTDPKSNRWAFGDVFNEVQRMFGVPANWRKDSKGNLVYSIETPEFESAVAFMKKLYDGGYVHPTVVAGDTSQAKDLFESGRMLVYVDGVGAWHEALERQRPSNPSFDMQAFAPYAHDGGRPIVWINDPTQIMMFINKNLPSDKIDQMLRIANFAAATIGSEEFQLVQYGVEGVHYKKGPDGSPVATDQGKREVTYTYAFLAGRPDSIVEPQYPDFVRTSYDWQSNAAKYLEKSPFYGLRVEEPAQLTGIRQPFDDKVNDILRGRAPVSDLKPAVDSWRQRGGSQLRDFYGKLLKG